MENKEDYENDSNEWKVTTDLDQIRDDLVAMKDPVMEQVRKDIIKQLDLIIHKPEINVLILYTGGTFGMSKTKDGYKPVKNWLLQRLHSNQMFYDKEYTKKFYVEETSCTPLTAMGQRLRYHFHEYDTLIDSSELNSLHYGTIAESIEENYDKYDSFIVIYGTDTMWYMASQLSFMFENLNKTIWITGSQIPISEWRNDAEANLIGAFTVAEHCIPEVCIYFNGLLLRGNRSCKESSTKLAAFMSPNFPELAKFDVFLNFRTDLILEPPKDTHHFQVFKNIERRVAVLFVHPLITASIFLSAFKKAKAIILQTYGMGNFPLSRVDLVEIIQDAIQKYGKTVVIVSQCRKGFVRGSYASSVELQKYGVILAEDMTIEWVIAKLSYLLGKGYRGKEVEEFMTKDIRGEVSIDAEVSGQKDKVVKLQKFMDIFGDKFDDNKSEDLNFIAKILQPIMTHTWAADGNIKKLESLIEQGIDINSQGKDGKTALHIAVIQNDVAMVEFLLKQDSTNINIHDYEGNTPLFYAWFNGNSKIAEMLIFKDAVFIDYSTYSKQFKKEESIGHEFQNVFDANQAKLAHVLCDKALTNDFLSIKLFFKSGANIEVCDYDKRTLAHVAAAESHEKILDFLSKDTFFNMELKDRWGRTSFDEIKDDILRQKIRQQYLSKRNIKSENLN